MELYTLNLSLCRIPAFSINDELGQVWPDLKAKIKLASPSFYEQVDTVEANDIEKLP